MKIAVLLLLSISSFSANAYKFIVYFDDGYDRVYDSEKIESYGMFGMRIQRLCEKNKYIERVATLNGTRDVYRKHETGSQIKCEILQETY